MNADLFWQMRVSAPIENTQVLKQFGKRKLTDYEAHRYWLLHELRQCRAQARNGSIVKSAKKALQKELAKLRRISKGDDTPKRARPLPDSVPVVAGLHDPVPAVIASDDPDVVRPHDDHVDSGADGTGAERSPPPGEVTRGVTDAQVLTHPPAAPGVGTTV